MPDGSYPPVAAPEAAAATPRGAAPVGRVSELPALEAGAVLYLRLWFAGETGRSRVVADFAALLGLGHGAAAASAFDRLCGLIATHGRRPMMRHGVECGCLGGDEACFAQLIALAAAGEREEAMLMASLMLRADMAPLAVAMAEELAVALRRMALRVGPAAPRAEEAPLRRRGTLH